MRRRPYEVRGPWQRPSNLGTNSGRHACHEPQGSTRAKTALIDLWEARSTCRSHLQLSWAGGPRGPQTKLQ